MMMAEEKDGDAAVDRLHIPGRDPNPKASVEKVIKLGWTLTGLVLSGSILGAVLKTAGYFQWPTTSYQWLRTAAVAVAVVNIGIWMWFPLDDLAVLRHWVRSRKRRFPGQTAEFWSIMLAMVLLLVLIGGAIYSPVAFGVAGMAVYLWNIVGYVQIRRIVKAVAAETLEVYSAEPEPWRTPLLSALAVIAWYWNLDEQHRLGGWQQERHAVMFGGFLLVALLGGTAPVVRERLRTASELLRSCVVK
jgi:hypothetical protein